MQGQGGGAACTCWGLREHRSRAQVPRGIGAASRVRWSSGGQAVTLSGMPFKHNAARRHRVPKARYRVQNRPVYEAGLKRRGDLTLWLDEDVLTGWQAPRRSTPGGQAW